MNKYEITFIVKSDMEEAEIRKTAEAMKKVLTDKNAKILEEKVMGQRELAYEINKMKTGYYFLYVVEADSDTVKEFNRVSGINENLLRHLIVKVED
ncbi:MAG: 30S ribosomal protein S6 [Bacilli bacterium]|nr:30S ribosomal protein S6 [Bacilli bacterium]